MHLLKMAVAAMIILPVPAAKANDRITPVAIQKFLDETTALTHQTNTRTDQDISAYLTKHLSDTGRFASSVLYEIPGHPATPKDIMLNKEQFISNVISGRKQMRDYTSSVKLYAHSIRPDGLSADIETITNERGQMPVSPTDFMPFEGTTVCKQTLDMVQGDLVLSRADCEARIGFIE